MIQINEESLKKRKEVMTIGKEFVIINEDVSSIMRDLEILANNNVPILLDEKELIDLLAHDVPRSCSLESSGGMCDNIVQDIQNNNLLNNNEERDAHIDSSKGTSSNQNIEWINVAIDLDKYSKQTSIKNKRKKGL